MKFDLTKYEKKKTEILEATFECVYEKGLANTGMRAIAEKANVNQATVHYYFKTKENLFNEFITALSDRCIYDILRRYKTTDPPEKKLQAIFEAGRDFCGKNQKMFTVFLECWTLSTRNRRLRALLSDYYARLVRVVEDVIAEGVSQGKFHAVDKETISVFLVALVEGIGLQSHMRRKDFNFKMRFVSLKRDLEKIIIGEAPDHRDESVNVNNN
ncbi:MAG: TetR/AcrR family transcriptional regulator [Deltaproteobacteria bacterium]|nr:TetR/AcrR family transcriptional regulator [Deltaproteobacteria bacterium]